MYTTSITTSLISSWIRASLVFESTSTFTKLFWTRRCSCWRCTCFCTRAWRINPHITYSTMHSPVSATKAAVRIMDTRITCPVPCSISKWTFVRLWSCRCSCSSCCRGETNFCSHVKYRLTLILHPDPALLHPQLLHHVPGHHPRLGGGPPAPVPPGVDDVEAPLLVQFGGLPAP